jgi:hypothetical protein
MDLGGLCCEVGCGGLPAVCLQDARSPPVFNLLRLADGAEHTVAGIGELVNSNVKEKQGAADGKGDVGGGRFL